MSRPTYPEMEENLGLGESFKPRPTSSEIREMETIKQPGPFLPRSLAIRSLMALLSIIPVILVLWGFQRYDDLGTWDRRAFNTLSLSAIALMSLFLGSVTQYLGSMIRWPLLASRSWSPGDVDRILGISDPTISIQIIWSDIWTRSRRYSKATATASVYLFAVVGGSLGVAILGLTYDLNEVDGINYPVLVTDWGTPAWVDEQHNTGLTWRRFGDYASIGLASVPTAFDMSNTASYTGTNISGQGLDRKVGDDGKVTYSYHLKEYQGLDVGSSKENILHSSSRCLGRNMFDGKVYEKGKLVGKYESDAKVLLEDDSSPEWLAILNGMYGYIREGLDFFWVAGIDTSQLSTLPGCATTYIHTETYTSYDGTTAESRNVTLYECTTCLTDSAGSPDTSTIFRNLSASNALWASNELLTTGTFERVYAFYARPQQGLHMRQYSSQNTTLHFLSNLKSFASDNFKDNPDRDDIWYSKPVPLKYEIQAAHLTAQLPILAVIGAETQLPRVTKEEGASEEPFTQTRLQVKWRYVAISLTCIQVILWMLIVATCWICWKMGTPLPDHDSYLSVAWLFRTVMVEHGREIQVSDGSGGGPANGKRIAQGLGEQVGSISYRLRRNGDGRWEWGLH